MLCQISLCTPVFTSLARNVVAVLPHTYLKKPPPPPFSPKMNSSTLPALRCPDYHLMGVWVVVAASLCLFAGCGTTKNRQATQQLILSDAVDRSVASIDFTPLAGQKTYLDARYVKNVKGMQFVNADYIISSLRQQMAAARCLLQESPDDADVIVEARVGALGFDEHDVTFGVPASSAVTSAAALLPTAPPVPAIPEIAFAKRYDEAGTAKVVAFAYDRETREPLWQSGVRFSESTAKDSWVLGAGPFRRGSIHQAPKFLGNQFSIASMNADRAKEKKVPLVNYMQGKTFEQPHEMEQQYDAAVASFEEGAEKTGDDQGAKVKEVDPKSKEPRKLPPSDKPLKKAAAK